MESIFKTLHTSALRAALVDISYQLDIDRLHFIQLRFLCHDVVPVQCHNTLGLFHELETRKFIEPQNVVNIAELLWRIWRNDLIKKHLVNNIRRCEDYFKIPGNSFLSAYRRLLHDLCENMIDRSFSTLKEIVENYRELEQYSVNKLHEPQELFLLMEEHNLINQYDHDLIYELIPQLKDSCLDGILAQYPRHSSANHALHAPGAYQHDGRREATRHSSSDHHVTSSAAGARARDTYRRPPSVHDYALGSSSDMSHYMEHQPAGDEFGYETNHSVEGLTLESYKMTSEPRGLCVIMNNINFQTENLRPGALKLRQRMGGQRDLEFLVSTWEYLGFTVLQYSDLQSHEMVNIMSTIGYETDHSLYDAFVLCVMTHGAYQHVFGTDGMPVKIDHLINPVKAELCKSLANKPKMFFIQACQGSDKQEGYFVPPDADTETDGGRTRARGVLEFSSAPNEADILVSYATVPGFVSYRSRSDGSFYITELCSCLQKYHHRYDLMTILTEVNRCVAEKDAPIKDRTYKQMPEPRSTLRKAVYLYGYVKNNADGSAQLQHNLHRLAIRN